MACQPPEGAQGDDPDEIPQVGRPPNLPFSEASGNFRIETDADRTTVKMEDPLTFIVRIVARGPVRKPPRRLALSELPAFQQDFHIEDLPDAAEVLPLASLVGLATDWSILGGLAPPTVWEFRYRLKPKSLAVQEIPALPFVFYNGKILSPERRFQVHYADAISIQVKPREVVQTALQGPAAAFQLATGPGVLARVQPWSLPRLGTLALLLPVPPLVCVVWYLVWRRLYPNAVRQAQQQRSRAARQALDLLRRLPAAPEQRARMAGTAVTRYLRLRLDLPFEEPTPTETAAYLLRRGCSLDRVDRVMQFYQACAAACFRPVPPNDAASLPDRAAALILDVEADT